MGGERRRGRMKRGKDNMVQTGRNSGEREREGQARASTRAGIARSQRRKNGDGGERGVEDRGSRRDEGRSD